MHIRVRNNVAQLIRTTYDKDSKKGKNTIVGRVKLSNPVLDDATRQVLTDAELGEFEHWAGQQQRASLLREELAALTLASTMAEASRWLKREGETPAGRAAATDILSNWQSLRRTLKQLGVSD